MSQWHPGVHPLLRPNLSRCRSPTVEKVKRGSVWSTDFYREDIGPLKCTEGRSVRVPGSVYMRSKLRLEVGFRLLHQSPPQFILIAPTAPERGTQPSSSRVSFPENHSNHLWTKSIHNNKSFDWVLNHRILLTVETVKNTKSLNS